MIKKYAFLDNDNIAVNIVLFDDPTEELLNSFIELKGLSRIVECPTEPDTAISGRKYHDEDGHFWDEKFYPSWVKDLTIGDWVPPVPYPTDGNHYLWDEESISWTLAPEV